ncbi:ShlB/FhaC/HecB family hemolysin secretion/activation protein [Phreatobacter stygius]|nr:ShlB/FhaC/HecB family hemolysin secretion/activation protein [Phreatobacter stygius]
MSLEMARVRTSRLSSARRLAVRTGGVLLAVAIGAGMSVPGFAQAPSPSQVTPRSLAPDIQRSPTGVVLPEVPAGQVPPGAAGVTLRVGAVVVEGGDPGLAPDTAAITATLRGRTVSIAAVYAAAAAIEQLYASRGYFLTRVVIPPQDARHGGTLRLRVVEGFVEAIDSSRLSSRVRGRVDTITAGLVGVRRLTLAVFERKLLLAGDTPGLALRSRLEPGSATGAVKLVLDGEHRPLGADLSIDNSLPKSLGTTSATLSAAFQSAAGMGELAYITASGSPSNGWLASEGPRRLVAAGIILPLGADGLTFNAEATLSDTHPRNGPGVLQTESTLRRLAFRLAYPLIRSRTTSLTLRAALEVTDEQQRAPLFDIALYDDRLRPIRIGADLVHVVASTGTSLGLGFDFSQGFHWLGSRGRADATLDRPISRALGNDVFSKLEFRARLTQALAWNFALELSGRAQYALTGPLLNSERFTLGGPRSLSALDSGLLAGDSGWLIRAELQYSALIPPGPAGQGAMVPYLFVARGQAVNLRPTIVERRTVGATNVGAGVRATVVPNGQPLAPRAIDLGLEGARQIGDGPGHDGWRVNANASVKF